MTNTTIGEQLRKARLAQNLNLSLIAEETKISKFYLEAIEANQIERLPGLFFYKAFVRQYSLLLNLDGKKLEDQIVAEHGRVEINLEELRQMQVKKPMLNFGSLLRAVSSLSNDLRLVSVSVGLVLVLAGGSMVYTWMQRPSSTGATDLASRETGSSAAVESQANAAADRTVDMRRVVDNLTPEAGPDSSVSLSLSASEPTWITIASDGKLLYTGILKPQQSKLLASKERVVIKVGNAAGLEVKWNGKPIGKLGDSKQVRTILFTDKEYQIVKPVTVSSPNSDPVSE